MNEVLNGNNAETDHVETVLALLQDRKEKLEQALALTKDQIVAAETLMTTLGGVAVSLPRGFATPEQAEGYKITHPHAVPTAKLLPLVGGLKGLSIKEAVLAYARTLPDGLYRVSEAAKAFIADGVGGYKRPIQATAPMYWHLKKDPRFTKIAPGVFRFKESLSGPGITKRMENAKRVAEPIPYGDPRRVSHRAPAHPAVGRDHSLVPIPPGLHGFDIDSIRGLNYLDAAVRVARFLGGTMTSKEMTAAFWHADLAASATTPSRLTPVVWGSVFNGKGKEYFQTLGNGQYRLIK